MADNSTEIAKLKNIRRAGVKRVSADGVTTEFDQDAVAKQLRELEAKDNSAKGKRPTAARIKLSGL